MGASKQQIAWLKSLPEYQNMVKVLGEYDDSIDYVGAVGDWKSEFIPRSLWLIDINICAYIHDYWYYIGGSITDRFKADAMFLADMLRWIEQTPDRWYIYGFNWGRRGMARRRALKYFEAVRLAGDKAFHFHAEEVLEIAA